MPNCPTPLHFHTVFLCEPIFSRWFESRLSDRSIYLAGPISCADSLSVYLCLPGCWAPETSQCCQRDSCCPQSNCGTPGHSSISKVRFYLLYPKEGKLSVLHISLQKGEARCSQTWVLPHIKPEIPMQSCSGRVLGFNLFVIVAASGEPVNYP